MRIPAKLMLMVMMFWSGNLMAISVSTHLMFQGDAEAAVELYTSTFADFRVHDRELHQSGEQEGQLKMANASFGGHKLIIFDSPPVHDFSFTPSVSLFVEFDSAEELKRVFDLLSEGGKVTMPLDEYGFSPLFGWLQDRFGVSWQLSLRDPGQHANEQGQDPDVP